MLSNYPYNCALADSVWFSLQKNTDIIEEYWLLIWNRHAKINYRKIASQDPCNKNFKLFTDLTPQSSDSLACTVCNACTINFS